MGRGAALTFAECEEAKPVSLSLFDVFPGLKRFSGKSALAIIGSGGEQGVRR